MLAFATAKLGVVLVPVNFMLGAEEIAFILRHSGASGMVAEDALAPTAEKALAAAELAGGVRGWIGCPARPDAAGRTSTTGGRRARRTTPEVASPTTTRCG